MMFVSEPISLAKTALKYNSVDTDLISFKGNADATVYMKSGGTNKDLWFVEIDGQRGFVSTQFLKENKMFTKKADLILVPYQHMEHQSTPQVHPEKVQQRHEVVDGTTIYASSDNEAELVQFQQDGTEATTTPALDSFNQELNVDHRETTTVPPVEGTTLPQLDSTTLSQNYIIKDATQYGQQVIETEQQSDNFIMSPNIADKYNENSVNNADTSETNLKHNENLKEIVNSGNSETLASSMHDNSPENSDIKKHQVESDSGEHSDLKIDVTPTEGITMPDIPVIPQDILTGNSIENILPVMAVTDSAKFLNKNLDHTSNNESNEQNISKPTNLVNNDGDQIIDASIPKIPPTETVEVPTDSSNIINVQNSPENSAYVSSIDSLLQHNDNGNTEHVPSDDKQIVLKEDESSSKEPTATDNTPTNVNTQEAKNNEDNFITNNMQENYVSDDTQRSVEVKNESMNNEGVIITNEVQENVDTQIPVEVINVLMNNEEIIITNEVQENDVKYEESTPIPFHELPTIPPLPVLETISNNDDHNINNESNIAMETNLHTTATTTSENLISDTTTPAPVTSQDESDSHGFFSNLYSTVADIFPTSTESPFQDVPEAITTQAEDLVPTTPEAPIEPLESLSAEEVNNEESFSFVKYLTNKYNSLLNNHDDSRTLFAAIGMYFNGSVSKYLLH